MNCSNIENVISDSLNCHYVNVTGDGSHFQAIVVSDDFDKKSRVQQQQMVYQCVQQWLQSGELHAFSIKTYTIKDWEKNTDG